jgi:O-antigen/teichoic acid export membrane protein
MLKNKFNGHWPIFFLTSLSSMSNLFLPVILVRLLDPADVGIYKIFFLHLMAIPFIFMAGGPIHSVFYWMGIDPKERTKYLNATWVLTLVASMLILIVGFPLQHFLSHHLGLPLKYVQLMLFTGFLICPSSHFSETTIASGFTARGSIFGTSFEFIKTIGFLTIAVVYKNLETIFMFYLGVLFIKLIIGAYLNRKRNLVTFETDKEHIKKVLIYCLPISFTGCLGFFIDKIDLLVLSSKINSAEFAFYSMGCLVIPPLYLLEMSVQKILIPELSKEYINRNWNLAAKHFRKSVGDIAFLIIPGIFGLCTFAKPIVTVLYTEAYLESVIYLQIFAFSYLLLIFPHDSVARASGQTSWILKVYIVLTPISLISVYLGSDWLSLKGLLVLSIVLKFIPKFLGMRFSKQIMHWSWKEMFPTRKLVSFTATSAFLSAISILLEPLFEDSVWWFFICGTVFAAAYLGTMMFLRNKQFTNIFYKIPFYRKMESP